MTAPVARHGLDRPFDGDRFLTTDEVAQRYRTNPSTVRYWRHVGYGPVGEKFGRRVLYRESDLIRWEQEKARNGSAA
ncbi:helix-turn-helix transcriptional regulator [Planomonospora venezuelensis]|uniref:Helix-turn-helix domain-containing protein n=1 Tax=Planomonospora venezuelensis TaxID=1999 RepID=A0A841CXJ6_PLAVE|nr:helix-turn-helix domain-containing protein [Planomonospora venezuelensis]MBB5960848.1 hypothetical protein [Planomonospora venezuelensis]GIN01082.1 hypothetical protein Pve01_27400 [Planomonospora venezuelensis]